MLIIHLFIFYYYYKKKKIHTHKQNHCGEATKMNVNYKHSKTSRVHYQVTFKTNPLVPQIKLSDCMFISSEIVIC